jgi:hypothetical protein
VVKNITLPATAVNRFPLGAPSDIAGALGAVVVTHNVVEKEVELETTTFAKILSPSD